MVCESNEIIIIILGIFLNVNFSEGRVHDFLEIFSGASDTKWFRTINL